MQATWTHGCTTVMRTILVHFCTFVKLGLAEMQVLLEVCCHKPGFNNVHHMQGMTQEAVQAVLRTFSADTVLTDTITPLCYRTEGRFWGNWILALIGAEILRAGDAAKSYSDPILLDMRDLVCTQRLLPPGCFGDCL